MQLQNRWRTRDFNIIGKFRSLQKDSIKNYNHHIKSHFFDESRRVNMILYLQDSEHPVLAGQDRDEVREVF